MIVWVVLDERCKIFLGGISITSILGKSNSVILYKIDLSRGILQ